MTVLCDLCLHDVRYHRSVRTDEPPKLLQAWRDIISAGACSCVECAMNKIRKERLEREMKL